MISFDLFDYCVAVGTVIGLIMVFALYRRDKRSAELPWFDMTMCPPPPGATAGEIREWRRWMREKKINRNFPSGGYQPQDDISSPPPTGGSGVPDFKNGRRRVSFNTIKRGRL